MFLFLLKICPLRRTEEQNQVLFIFDLVHSFWEPEFHSQRIRVNKSIPSGNLVSLLDSPEQSLNRFTSWC